MKELDLEWVGGPEDIHQLLKRSDFVVLCLPYTPETQNLINPASISFMKRSAFLINLSRGGLVNRRALQEALASGTIAGAGLDVFWEEPPDPSDPIFNFNVLATPHIAGSTDVSIRGIVKAVSDNILRLEKNKEPLYVKN
jgi:phosphoglycerate dehydrogenase-like enzyme